MLDLKTHKFKVSTKYDKEDKLQLGAYTLIVAPKEGVFIQGVGLTNLATMPIQSTTIIPLSPTMAGRLKEYPFIIYDDEVVYQVTYGSFAWYFPEYVDAIGLVNAIVQLKTNGLNTSFTKEDDGK